MIENDKKIHKETLMNICMYPIKSDYSLAISLASNFHSKNRQRPSALLRINCYVSLRRNGKKIKQSTSNILPRNLKKKSRSTEEIKREKKTVKLVISFSCY